MVSRITPFRIPFPRRFLIRLHRDLFTIDRYIDQWAESTSTLTLFEKMVLVSEDRRFFRHNGIDYIAVTRDALKALAFRKHGGASTIDMQFVRTATGYYERSLRRKIYEMLLAALIQFRYSKIVILRSYLKHAFFGSHLIGAEAASKSLFNRQLSEIDELQASQLASMLIYPCPRDPGDKWAEKVKARSEAIRRWLPRFEKRFEKLPRWDAV